MSKMDEARDDTEKTFSRSAQREFAKAGMMASLGTLVLTGFLRFKKSWLLHTWAGVFLLGFSLWHHLLSQPKKAKAVEGLKAPRKKKRG